EFLQLGNSDRTRMMKELFNLEKYELFYKVTSLETKNNQQLQNLEGQLQQIGEIAPELIQTIESNLLEIKKSIKEINSEKALQLQQEEKLRKLKELTEKIAEATVHVSTLKALEPEFTLLDKKLQEYEYCLLNFKNLLDSLKESNNRISTFEQSLSADQEELKTIENQLSALKLGFEAIKKSYDERELFRQQAEELDKIKRINHLLYSNSTLKKRISDGEAVCHLTIENICQLTELQETTTKSIKQIREQIPDTFRLSDAKNWFTTMASLLSAKNEIALEWLSAGHELEKTEKARIELLVQDCFAGLSDTSTSADMESALRIKNDHIQQIVKELDLKIQHLTVQTKLEEYATHLEEGQACPLCGATSHPLLLNAKSVSEALNTLQKSKTDLQKEIKTLEQIQQQISELATTFRLNQTQLEKIQEKQKNHETKITTHQALFRWEEFKDEKTVNDAFTKTEKLQQEVKAKELELESISKRLQQENLNKDKYNKALEDFRHQLTANETETATLSAQIGILKLSDFENRTDAEMELEKDALLQKYRDIEYAYQTANNSLNIMQKSSDALHIRIELHIKALEQEKHSQNNIKTKLQHQLDQSPYTLFTEVEQILNQSLQLEEEKKKVSNYKLSLEVSEKQLKMQKAELGEESYDENVYQKTIVQLAQLSEEINLKNQQQGKLEDELKNTRAKLEAQKDLLEHVNTLRLRGEEIKTLKQLFKGSGFVSYISSVYLQELCRAANDRFYKLTKQRLSLEVTDDNNFQVRDFINGGKVRNVKTLSGGQTFQAALSLALALADNIQKITESNQNFFFLDEGFGSLDKESLDVVFDTLKSLRKENRIVGVISHVEEMQQEIDTHLRIMNEEERGSRIIASWE
ncbi:MAG: SbcC/MukB-like Walker B domain-containing protein, partial [Bacteroidales bacterium]|nr:SbcC/MukB-like Walker B domain-containing protein [Bacteroidales bacterium]